MIAGHTKFCPVRLFALLAKSFYSSDVFNEEQFLCVYGQHANVSLDKEGVVQCWRDVITVKYTNLPGIRTYHDFLAIKNPSTNAIMKVRELCHSGTL